MNLTPRQRDELKVLFWTAVLFTLIALVIYF